MEKLFQKISITFLTKVCTILKKLKVYILILIQFRFGILENEIKLLEERGYSTREMRSKLQRSFAFPFFLLSMVLLSGVLRLGIRFKENNWTYIFIAIITSVLIFTLMIFQQH